MIRMLAMCAVLTAACGVELEEPGTESSDDESGDQLTDELTGEDTDSDLDDTGQLRARVCASGTTTRGIDVSKWQGTINWTKVKAAGVQFAFIRVSDGANTPDARFAANWTGAKSAGVIRGAYQFFRPNQSITTQANMMINAIGVHRAGDLPPVIDIEDHGGLSPATLAARARIWVDKVHAAVGVRPIVYTGKYFWRDEVGSPASFGPNPLWIAQYTSLCPDIPAPWTRWTFWQYTDAGTVNGISGPVDTNRFNGSLAQLQAFVGL
jgi:lysozyme